jgi:thymidylate synthase
MKQYIDLLQHIITNGEDRKDRTGVGTRSVFGYQMRFDLEKGFPAVTTKKLAWKAMLSELLWFIEGSSDERRLCEILYGTRSPEKTTIWTSNANADYWKSNAKFDGDCGRIYGKQWREFRGGVKIAQPILSQRQEEYIDDAYTTSQDQTDGQSNTTNGTIINTNSNTRESQNNDIIDPSYTGYKDAIEQHGVR